VTENTTNAEDNSKIIKPVVKEVLTGVDRAMDSIKKAQNAGSWPKKEIPQSPTVTSDAVEEIYPTEKEYPNPEARGKILNSIRNQEPTIPPKIKKELTEEAHKLDTVTMGTEGEEAQKTTKLPKTQPFIEGTITPLPTQAPETIKAQGGAEPLKRILKAQEKVDSENAALQEDAEAKMKARILKKQVEVPSEAKNFVPPSQIPFEKPIPQPTIEPTPQEATQPLKSERKPFLSRTFRKIFGKE